MQPGAESLAALPLASGASAASAAGSLAATAVLEVQMTASLLGGPGSGVGSIAPTAVDHLRIEVGFSNFNVAVSGPIKVSVN
jgi:hypothetical protein